MNISRSHGKTGLHNMNGPSTNQAQRLVCTGRTVLAATTLIALTFDAAPPLPSRLLLGVVALYVVYALVALVRELTRVPTTAPRAQLLSHVGDLVFIVFLNYSTEGTSSPFFIFFMFALFAAALRFGSRAIMWTAFVLLPAFASIGIYWGLHGGEVDLSRLLIRTSYFVVAAFFLTFLARYQESHRREVEELAIWPRKTNPNLQSLLEDLLPRAAKLLNVPRVLLVWEDSDEPWVYVAEWSKGQMSIINGAPDDYLPVVSETVGSRTFFAPDCTKRFVVREESQATVIAGECPINQRIQQKYRVSEVFSVAFETEPVHGRAMYLDRAPTADDVALAEVVTALIAGSMEQHMLIQQLQRTAVAEERIRLARDLHDGILQSLAGANLHLHVLQRLIEIDPASALRSLAEVQSSLSIDQRELRSYIAQLRPAGGDGTHRQSFGDALYALLQRVERQWGLKVSANIDPSLEMVSPGMQEEIYRLAREAVLNAAKHADTPSIRLSASVRHERVLLVIEDDGHGMPFMGRYDLNALNALKRGPLTLKERISSLGGDLLLESNPDGTRLEITLPLSLTEVLTGAYAAVARG